MGSHQIGGTGAANLTSLGTSEKNDPADRLLRFLSLWTSYDTGIRSTALGRIYGADHRIELIRRRLDCRTVDARVQHYHDLSALSDLADMYAHGYIECSVACAVILREHHHYHANNGD